ncbi:MAG: hypothetical protein A3E98_03120 [Candidatus Doudnabacteria bacterium RIFCSPHIGHO2_12_FULL_48_11]|uniref:Helix-turn-helix type 11 domain-containing protein n=1 Tax=Candidatus Doudnabacteria bacterium RIFCSPHIGHO2_01_FULL_46_24 TaxID=1817825 RepID=A0A1F5NWF1_9BACT|nr:MAG: hypothetical protein A2720_03250 [Candidatus Doudnabacteria bacterium RIFCSPHIGHO2_01_FULL_46_24]OGE96031.1 MAG: hypothetical protein A3E98_03120 [Candidatus Doudnabacteria bacterium RIFCSPHIGHO2_12_FULL_48_11]
MISILISIIIILAAAVAGLAIYARREAKKHGTSATDEFAGICLTAVHRTVAKQQNLDKVLNLFAGRPELSNFEVRQALRVSSRTAVRYMDELERMGKVEQKGRTGHHTHYRVK